MDGTNPGQTTIPRVGVGLLLLDSQNRALLTLRKHPPEAGCWSIVGGKVDFLEKLEHCAVREAQEEIGVEVKLIRLLCVPPGRRAALGCASLSGQLGQR